MTTLVIVLLVLSVVLTSLDIITTRRAMRLGAIEVNPLVRDNNKKFVLWKGILFKGLEIGLCVGLTFSPIKWLAPTVLSLVCVAYTWVVYHNIKVNQSLSK